ncbi:amidase signature enzyme [Gloeophyllum trabeum ATCC 11539]|uniref:Glutamyl-tRNA(Gln) amidotransferase subunit A, mitochondrial n=1 Tax=Gloeophyllum trabeum (strain ATCC 11539 / FP-39264 / Madison 617) TaxID=670483 RepID=S7RNS9_GLOTA|nr:amidase signature enzyme [Gloeophyllum trabeum ATCC 11539]EPQ56175.1 amidase signature enzyme [Gloeophyllum trabeum ATCC 11539]
MKLARSLHTRAAKTNALVYTPPTPPPARPGPLSGTRVAVKDNICTRDMPTTCSSEMLRDFTSPFDATVVSLLRAAGAQIVGKANCDEFGMGSLNVHSIHGPVLNPWVPRDEHEHAPRSAGGSSGGSAAAVAAGLCDVALGTDTGGSVRLPAAYCGVVGLKPSYGLLSRWGVVSYSDSLDCVGVLARSVADVHKVFATLNHHDPRDPTSLPPSIRQRARSAPARGRDPSDLRGLTIGIPQEYFPAELPALPLRPLLRALRARGAALVPVSLPSTRFALSAYYVIASAEAGSSLGRFDGVRYGKHVPPPPGADRAKASQVYAHSRTKGFGREVRKRVLLGTYALSADAFDNYFLQAQRVRRLIKADFDRVFLKPNPLRGSPSRSDEREEEGKVDVLLHPSAMRTAPPLPAPSPATHLDAYVQDTLTTPASLAGLPALSVPAGLADGWPVGVSVVGQWGDEEGVLGVGRVVEAVVGM